MHRHRARSAALYSGLGLLLSTSALASPSLALAQAAAPPAAQAPATGPEATAPQATAPLATTAREAVVRNIEVRGNERIEPATVISYLPIQVGETIDPARIDLALKALFRTDLFADVRIDLQPQGTLVVTVEENPIINRVIFEGNKSMKEDKLREEVSVRPRGIFTRSKVQTDVARIVELYRRSGRISANVTPQIVQLPQKRVDLIFKIDEGAKSGILRVNFLGNKAFSDNDLRDVVVTEQSRWYKFFSSNSNYDPDRLEYDREQLRKYYRNRGYYDFRVSSAVAEFAPDKNGFAVTYTLDEGREYKFGKVTVDTELKKLNPDVLRALIPFKSGDLYEDQKIEQATDALTFAAGAAGFAFVDVRPRYTPNRESGLIDVTFEVKEGPRVYVERIDIVGNTQTLDYVIRREMNLVEGDPYNRALVDRSKNQVRGLGFFKDVEITEQPGSAPDRTNLQVKVTEQPTGEFSFSAGYSSVDQLVVDLGITQRNFRGRGQDVRGRVSLGSVRQQVDLGFTEPRFLGRDLAAGVDLYYYKYDLTDYDVGYSTNSVGTNFRLSFPMSLNSRGTLIYTLRSDDVAVEDSLCGTGQRLSSYCADRGTYLTSLVGYGYRLDRRNDPVAATRGYYLQFNQDFAGVGGDVQYIRTEGEAGFYYGLTRNFVFSFTGQAGHINGWGGDNVRINDRFYKGGNSFRGFETAGIGPRDLTVQTVNGATFRNDESLGGNTYAIGSVEMTVPTFLPEQYGIKAAVFSQFGVLGGLDDNITGLNGQPINPSDPSAGRYDIRDDMSLRASAGISVFWRSPMGPIRFDFSQVLAKEDYDKTELFKFSTGTRF